MGGPSASSELPFAELLARVAEATPAPGGGSSAGWACALGAALAEMCGAAGAAELRARALALAEADLTSYAPVLAATTPEARAAALSEAAEVPLAIAAAAAQVAQLAAGVVHGSKAGDAATGAAVAAAAARSAAHLVELNLASTPEDPRLEQARAYAQAAAQAASSALGRA
jgi:formiminotetrahydrofolate cyclodeaminase